MGLLNPDDIIEILSRANVDYIDGYSEMLSMLKRASDEISIDCTRHLRLVGDIKRLLYRIEHGEENG